VPRTGIVLSPLPPPLFEFGVSFVLCLWLGWAGLCGPAASCLALPPRLLPPPSPVAAHFHSLPLLLLQEFREWYNAGGSSFVPSGAPEAPKPPATSAKKPTPAAPQQPGLSEARALSGLKQCSVEELQEGTCTGFALSRSPRPWFLWPCLPRSPLPVVVDPAFASVFSQPRSPLPPCSPTLAFVACVVCALQPWPACLTTTARCAAAPSRLPWTPCAPSTSRAVGPPAQTAVPPSSCPSCSTCLSRTATTAWTSWSCARACPCCVRAHGRPRWTPPSACSVRATCAALPGLSWAWGLHCVCVAPFLHARHTHPPPPPRPTAALPPSQPCGRRLQG
jgi:hypothetical protein